MTVYSNSSEIVVTNRPLAEVKRLFGDSKGFKVYKGSDPSDIKKVNLVYAQGK